MINKIKEVAAALLLAISLSASIISLYLFTLILSLGGGFSKEAVIPTIIFLLGPAAYIFYKKYKEYKSNAYFLLSIIPGLVVITIYLINLY